MFFCFWWGFINEFIMKIPFIAYNYYCFWQYWEYLNLNSLFFLFFSSKIFILMGFWNAIKLAILFRKEPSRAHFPKFHILRSFIFHSILMGSWLFWEILLNMWIDFLPLFFWMKYKIFIFHLYFMLFFFPFELIVTSVVHRVFQRISSDKFWFSS